MGADGDAVVDALLERYLGLLDEYTALRASLGALQAAMYHSLARANFAAERGLRYGPDHYDDRMQARRRLRIAAAAASEGEGDGPAAASFAADSRRGRRQQPAADPLRWFGLLAPAPLRAAQASAVQAVEHVVPRLASLDAAMAELEIDVRRARKRRAKAAAVQQQQQEQQEQQQQQEQQAAAAGARGGSSLGSYWEGGGGRGRHRHTPHRTATVYYALLLFCCRRCWCCLPIAVVAR